jgi:heat-inducible transcriptional repressor
MAELERMGLLCSPHTSAGRKPTDMGLRYFVDSLMVVDADLRRKLESEVQHQLQAEQDVSRLLQRATSELATLTHFAGLVSVREQGFDRISRIELVPVSSDQLLAVIVSTRGEVQNRLIPRGELQERQQVEQAARRLSELLCDCSMEDVRKRLLNEMEHDRLRIRRLLQELKQWADNPIQSQTDLFMSGQRQLLEMPEFGVIETVRSLLTTFEEKKDLLRLVDEVEQTETGVKIFIGSEHALVDMEEVSVVLSRYEGPGRTVGTLGVIGPKRMHYDRVVPLVDCTARWVSRMLGTGS